MGLASCKTDRGQSRLVAPLPTSPTPKSSCASDGMITPIPMPDHARLWWRNKTVAGSMDIKIGSFWALSHQCRGYKLTAFRYEPGSDAQFAGASPDVQ